MSSRYSYNDLHTFMLVAREGSFTKAATKLNVAQSSVSRTIRALEKDLGVQLFTRTTRKMSLTQAGEQLYRTTHDSFQALDQSLSMLADYRDTPSGTVRINASQHAIDKVLLPRLSAFQQQYPEIKLVLISENRFVDIITEQFDAGVRLGDDVSDNMIAVRLTEDMEMVAVATPAHFRRYGFPKTPQDLQDHPCIAYQFADGKNYQWEFIVNDQSVYHDPVGQWVFADSYMEAAAAKLGLGLAYVPKDLVADALDQGQLIQVLKVYSCRFEGTFLYYPHRNVTPALRMVIDALKL
ncbi:transcriptional regulator, LysR family [Acinetobacter marinus]|uniref:Transcriptional regulator, LysR family n=1 Tax=Acinetobacter marinus TaxID=281375 RepID=A0A1G6N0B8_9GAMM|nr:LysR family transcriptional regulator [Acinetobacter marinus]SDC61278.1 transcriptional regulator, LysR family [Acinetobacter marinus]